MCEFARYLVEALVNCFTTDVLIEKNCHKPRQVRSSFLDYMTGFVHATDIDNNYFGWAAHRVSVAAQRLSEKNRTVPVQHDRADQSRVRIGHWTTGYMRRRGRLGIETNISSLIASTERGSSSGADRADRRSVRRPRCCSRSPPLTAGRPDHPRPQYPLAIDADEPNAGLSDFSKGHIER
jgi:hypothetical protein